MKPLLSGLSALLLGLLVFELVDEPSRFQWDFKTYWEAGRAFLAGGDPYSAPSGLPFVYPPITLPLFGGFSALPYEWAYRLWLILKLGSLAALIALWKRILPEVHLVAAASLFAFNASVAADLRAGNISVFEQVVLWAGVLLHLRGRSTGLALAVAVVAQFKLLPICLSAVFLLERPRPDWRSFLTCWAVFLGLFALDFAFFPAWTLRFLATAAAMDERGIINPASLAIARDLSGAHGLPLNIAWLFWLLFAAPVAFCALRAARAADRAGAVLVLTAAFALLAPRFKDYSYLLLVPAALRAIAIAPWTGMLVFAPHPSTPLPLLEDLLCSLRVDFPGALAPLVRYLPFWAALAVFLVLCRRVTLACRREVEPMLPP